MCAKHLVLRDGEADIARRAPRRGVAAVALPVRDGSSGEGQRVAGGDGGCRARHAGSRTICACVGIAAVELPQERARICRDCIPLCPCGRRRIHGFRIDIRTVDLLPRSSCGEGDGIRRRRCCDGGVLADRLCFSAVDLVRRRQRAAKGSDAVALCRSRRTTKVCLDIGVAADEILRFAGGVLQLQHVFIGRSGCGLPCRPCTSNGMARADGGVIECGICEIDPVLREGGSRRARLCSEICHAAPHYVHKCAARARDGVLRECRLNVPCMVRMQRHGCAHRVLYRAARIRDRVLCGGRRERRAVRRVVLLIDLCTRDAACHHTLCRDGDGVLGRRVCCCAAKGIVDADLGTKQFGQLALVEVCLVALGDERRISRRRCSAVALIDELCPREAAAVSGQLRHGDGVALCGHLSRAVFLRCLGKRTVRIVGSAALHLCRIPRELYREGGILG